MEYFKNKYGQELEINIRVFIEQIYLLRIDELSRLYNTGRSKSAAVLDFFISSLDIDNIKNAVSDLAKRFWDSVSRLVGRQTTSQLNNETGQLEPLTPYDVAAAIKRVGLWGAYFAYNHALISKLSQTLGADAKVMFLTKEDPRVDMDCIPYNRQIFRLTDYFLPTPPLHYNCRCVLVPKK